MNHGIKIRIVCNKAITCNTNLSLVKKYSTNGYGTKNRKTCDNDVLYVTTLLHAMLW
jgi:hypothetical protein